MSEDYERTLLQLPSVLAFKIPPRKTAGGHKAADWPTQAAWTGKLKIVSRGKLAVIILHDDKNQTFAMCLVNEETAVERTTDSGRYFVLRIQNAQGKYAFIGIAFNERNDAFDFNVALSEHKSQLERENESHKLAEDSASKALNLSMKEGEKITIKLSHSTGRKEKAVAANTNSFGSKGGFLAPPPGDNSSGNSSNTHQHVFSLPPASSSSSSSTSTHPPATSFSSADPFGSSDPFFSSDPFGSSAPSSMTTGTATTFSDPFGDNNPKSNNPFEGGSLLDF